MKLSFLALFLTCSTAFSAPKIVTSFSILQDLTKNLVPADFKVETIVNAGIDSHGYQVSAQDYLKLKKADLILFVGQNYEPWATKALEKIKSKAPQYNLTQDMSLLPLNEEHHHDHKHDDVASSNWDPHFWQSPQFVIPAIENLSLFLQDKFPQQKAEIAAKTRVYIKELKDIQKRYKSEFESIPKEKRKMVVPHNSFQYFANEFDVLVQSPLDASQEGDSSLQKVNSIIQTIKKEKISSLFLEKSSPSSLMKNIAKETKMEIKGTLYSDCLSTSEEASTYLKMIEYNFSLISNSMKGSKP